MPSERKASIPNPFARATHLQPTLLIAPENDQSIDVKPPPRVSQLPTPPAQSNEQQYEPLSRLRPATNTRCSNVGTAQTPRKTSHSGSEIPAISTCLHNTQSITLPSQQAGTPGFMGSRSGRTSPQERAPRRRRTDVRGNFASLLYSATLLSSLPAVQSTLPNPAGASEPPNLRPMRTENPAFPRTTAPRTTHGGDEKRLLI
ncbi:hypothetical protein IFR05_013973 [Cadophora sp. M221]|nr:hypothetical protein IFR05_013973 [Cadophora sp. M221]